MRYSLTLTNTSDITELTENIKIASISQVYLTHTKPDFHSLESAILLSKNLPHLDIVITISTKYFSSIHQIESLIEKGKLYNLNHYLIVSGYPKPDLDSIAVLQNIQSSTNFFCVYNPYETCQQIENQRLKQKLKNPHLVGVYLQIGIDPQKLEQAIAFIKKQNSELIIEGCLIKPTLLSRERLHKRPIHGIYLTEEYYTNQKYAEEVTNRIATIYNQNNILVIMEDFKTS